MSRREEAMHEDRKERHHPAGTGVFGTVRLVLQVEGQGINQIYVRHWVTSL
jgi:hypothetical protein